MTHLTKSVRREAHTSYGPIIITLAPEGIYTREKGRRTTYGPIALGKIHTLGAQMKADEIRRARAAARKARKALRTGGR